MSAVSEEKFHAAVNVIRSLPKEGPYQPSNDMMLKFYSLFKQATEGPCKDKKPSFYEVVKLYKWNAWNRLGDMTKEAAMEAYVEELKKIVETMSYTGDVAAFIEALGPFYEYVDGSSCKDSDSNHNITEKSLANLKKSELLSNHKIMPQLNGKKPSSINYEDNHLDEDSEGDDVTGPSSDHSPDSDHGYFIVNGTESLSDSEMTHVKAAKVNDDHSLLNGVVGNNFTSNTINGEFKCNQGGALPRKIMTDTESDEEYSEPAETPELLQQKQKTKKEGGHHRTNGYEDEGNQMPSLVPPSSLLEDQSVVLSGSQVVDILTYGGGDAADAGKIGLSVPHQSKQESSTSRRQGEAIPSSELRTPIHVGGAGRRRRDSDNPNRDRGRFFEDVNAQLIIILQKIHQDLQEVVARLDNLEAQALNHHQDTCSTCQRRLGRSFANGDSSWWPFPELSPRSTFFLLTWPLILHGAVKLLLFLRSRRRNKN